MPDMLTAIDIQWRAVGPGELAKRYIFGEQLSILIGKSFP